MKARTMKLTRIATAFLFALLPASVLAQDPTPGKLWQELEQALPR